MPAPAPISRPWAARSIATMRTSWRISPTDSCERSLRTLVMELSRTSAFLVAMLQLLPACGHCQQRSGIRQDRKLTVRVPRIPRNGCRVARNEPGHRKRGRRAGTETREDGDEDGEAD